MAVCCSGVRRAHAEALDLRGCSTGVKATLDSQRGLWHRKQTEETNGARPSPSRPVPPSTAWLVPRQACPAQPACPRCGACPWHSMSPPVIASRRLMAHTRIRQRHRPHRHRATGAGPHLHRTCTGKHNDEHWKCVGKQSDEHWGSVTFEHWTCTGKRYNRHRACMGKRNDELWTCMGDEQWTCTGRQSNEIHGKV